LQSAADQNASKKVIPDSKDSQQKIDDTQTIDGGSTPNSNS
jgi:hypothetical protein